MTGFDVYQVGDGEYRLLIENSQDGNPWTTFLDAFYRRAG